MMPEVISVCHLSNGKKQPGCFGDLLGMKSYSVYVVITIRHYFRIPMKQRGFNGK